MLARVSRILTVILLALYGVGMPQFAHRALQHNHDAASVSACGHDHHEDDHAPTPQDDQDRAPRSTGDHCPTCEMLVGNVAVAAQAPLLVEIAGAGVAAGRHQHDPEVQASCAWTLGPRGPPTGAIA